MTTRMGWFEAHTTEAPPVLVERARRFLSTQPADASIDAALAGAATAALAAAIDVGTSREAALDLLAADALITLALHEGAERDPAGLGTCARALRIAAADQVRT